MTGAAPRIALLDDEEPVRRAFQRLLTSAGLTVDAFATGPDFLASLAADRPDCMILDLHMPVMDGFAVQERLTRDGLHVPVVMITGHDSPETRARALAAGAVAYLRKPVDAQLLLDTINAALHARRS